MKKSGHYFYLAFTLAVFIFNWSSPSMAQITVDGLTTDWNLSQDYHSPMYRAFNASNQHQSDLYIRYDCTTQTVYALVLTLPAYPGLNIESFAWIAINTIGNKPVIGSAGNNGIPPDFSWVGLGYDGDQTHVQGYEASFTLAPGSYKICAHIEIYDSGEQTSGNYKSGSTLMVDLVLDCTGPTGPTGATGPIGQTGPTGPTGPVVEYDFGDAPNSYGTSLASDGARHVVGALYLGTMCDSELDAWVDPHAKGDDDNGTSDEDGVKFLNPLTPCQKAAILVTASAAGKLDAWFDFNIDGDWSESNEHIFASQNLKSGKNLLQFAIPCEAKIKKETFVRFRFSSTGALAPTGAATDGEIEDYAVELTYVHDPMGYIYCEQTGQIVTGGTVEVDGPAGTFTLISNGSSGYYEFITDGTSAVYTITYNLPSGYVFSTSCLANPTPLDPTGMSNPVVLGSSLDASNLFLQNWSCSENPYYFAFDLAQGDAFIHNNNIPLICGESSMIHIKKYTNGHDADSAPGPVFIVDNPITWTYQVYTHSVRGITNVSVTDDNGTPADMTDDFHPTFIGGDDGDHILEVGEIWRFEATSTVQLGPYGNYALAVGQSGNAEVRDADPSHYYGEFRTNVKPDDFVVALTFKDKDGKAVGNVLAYLMVPGEQDWKVLSSDDVKLLWGKHPYNALFRGLIVPMGGVYKFRFIPPTGYHFVSPDHMELKVPTMETFYSFTGHEFILSNTEDAADPVDESSDDNGQSSPGNCLHFNTGSPSFKGEGWDNAIDKDVEGWDGTATVKADESGAAWAIFDFKDGQIYQFDYFTMQTDNGVDDDQYASRQASLVKLMVSETGTLPSDFISIGTWRIKSPEMTWYNLGQIVKAKYVKLIILEPKWGQGGWRQIVEFDVNTKTRIGALLTNGESVIAVLPQEFKLEQNYPNPFNPVTNIIYHLAEDAQVEMKIYDLQGREVAVLANEMQNAGIYHIQWFAGNMPSGVYFCCFKAGTFKKINKMILTK